MDLQPQLTTKTISDDQELAKALAGVTDSNLGFEETPMPVPAPVPAPAPAPDNAPIIINNPEPVPTSEPEPEPAPIVEPAPVDDPNDLEEIKQDALLELKPLIDKLNIAPEEKFDIYLLLLRSTDDKTLIAPAHIAAQNIVDEARRAQALLDIIKEIDYLSGASVQAAN
jgi:hypothetical protein